VDTYRIVLFLHLLALLLLTGAISVFGVSYFRLGAAQSLQDAAPWAALAGRTGWLFPVSIIGLFASGAYLTSDRWTWSTPWIDVSIAGVVLVAVQGPSVAGPAAKHLERALRERPAEGRVSWRGDWTWPLGLGETWAWSTTRRVRRAAFIDRLSRLPSAVIGVERSSRA
jgi:hypothetical protein